MNETCSVAPTLFPWHRLTYQSDASAHPSRRIVSHGDLPFIRLISAHIRHLDLADEFNSTEALRHYQWNEIRSLRVHEDRLHESTFPSFDQLIVRMSSLVENINLYTCFTQR